MLKPPKYEHVYETFKTTEKTWENIAENESYVKTGDPVVEVQGGEPKFNSKERYRMNACTYYHWK